MRKSWVYLLIAKESIVVMPPLSKAGMARKQALLLLLILSTCSCGSRATFAVDPEDARPSQLPLLHERKWQANGLCGVNVAYMLLRYYRMSVEHDQLVEKMSPTEKGSSLLELRDALRRHGLKSAEVVEMPLDDLLELGVPVIVHQELGSEDGHYAILFPIKNQEGQYATIDGLECQWYFRSKDYFAFSYTGYAVTPIGAAKKGNVVVATAASFLIGAFLTTCFIKIYRRRSAAISSAALILSLGAYGCREEPGLRDSSNLPWVDVGSLAAAENNFRVVSEADLKLLADSVKPYWQYRRVSDYLHALRLWGPNCDFPSSAPYPVNSGVEPLATDKMLEELLNSESFNEGYGPGSSLLIKSRSGVLVRINGDEPGRSVAHVDDLLAVLAEIGVERSAPVKLDGSSTSVDAILRDSTFRFDPSQELEFTSVAYSTYFSDSNSFGTKLGNRVSFDKLAASLISSQSPPVTKACYGSHVPYGVAYLLRIDNHRDVLSESVRRQLRLFLAELAARCETEQLDNGLFAIPNDQEIVGSEETAALTYTGHTLEWIAIADPALRPSDACIERAIRAAVRELISFPAGRLSLGHEYGPRSHCVRAIFLLHGYSAERNSRELSK